MNYLAAELTRYHLEVSFLYEAELRGTNPKEIRINDQWRIIFKWIEDHSYKVEILDYHK